MSSPRLALIVEGHGEVTALPELVRRIARALEPPVYPQIIPPIRRPKHALIHTPRILETTIELAVRNVSEMGGIMVLLDSDKDCSVELASTLHRRAAIVRHDVPISVVIARHEFEAWFIAASASLVREGVIIEGEHPSNNPDEISNTKAWIRNRMSTGTYRETLDQVRLASVIDLQEARLSRSFRKFHKEIEAPLIAAHLKP